MLVPFFRGSVSFGVIQANNNYRNVISGASFHGLFQQSLAASRNPLLALESLVFESLHNLHNLNIIKSIPKSIRSHDDEIMGINFETGYLGFANYHFIVAFFGAILGLEITKRSSCGEPSRKHSQWSHDHVVLPVDFSDCGGLIDFSSRLHDAFLLFGIGGFVVFCNLIAFWSPFTH